MMTITVAPECQHRTTSAVVVTEGAYQASMSCRRRRRHGSPPSVMAASRMPVAFRQHRVLRPVASVT
jgi:hypothetical protein